LEKKKPRGGAGRRRTRGGMCEKKVLGMGSQHTNGLKEMVDFEGTGRETEILKASRPFFTRIER